MERREGLAKLTGREAFVDDLAIGSCLWGATVRSPAPRGRIRSVRFGRGVDWSRFVVVDARDLPGPNSVRHVEDDQPILARDGVRHVHEPVLLLAHESREAVRRAAREIEIVVDPEPAVLDFRRSPRPDQIQHGEDNVFGRVRIEKGDVDAAFARAPHRIEGSYETGAQEHLYLETQGMLAWVEAGVVTVQGSMQCPFFVEEALRHALGRSAAEIRVIQAATGGGFGGKEDFPSVVALHAALLALASGRKVKLIYDRREDMASTTKRHPSRIRQRAAVDRDGRLLAREIEILLDGGAYVTLSPVVLSRAAIHAAGPYTCDNVRVSGRVVLTNSVPFGAFRGFGAPQSHFAGERHMDVVASRLDLDPAELRRRNLIRDGDTTATEQVIADGTDRVALQDRALELASYQEKRDGHVRFNRSHPYLRRGIGLASYQHGAGFTGAGEERLDSRVRVAGLADGTVEVRCSSTEMGQGTTTILTQIAATRLGIPPEWITIARPDTARVPDSGPTVASRTAMIVGKLVENACDDLRRRLGLEPDAPGEALRAAIGAWRRDPPDSEPVGESRYETPPHVQWDEERHHGAAYGAYSWATQVAEVEVDLRTYTARVVDFVAVQDVGHVLNQTLARGQVQGGVAQSIGWALLEECRWRDGALENDRLSSYAAPTSRDIPEIRVEFVESPYPHGGLGAKGLGELPADGPAAAIANAVAAATQTQPRSIPLTPERLMALIEEKQRP
jgi:CO/xanthine dehydrogenase Mo-binding subunit